MNVYSRPRSQANWTTDRSGVSSDSRIICKQRVFGGAPSWHTTENHPLRGLLNLVDWVATSRNSVEPIVRCHQAPTKYRSHDHLGSSPTTIRGLPTIKFPLAAFSSQANQQHSYCDRDLLHGNAIALAMMCLEELGVKNFDHKQFKQCSPLPA